MGGFWNSDEDFTCYKAQHAVFVIVKRTKSWNNNTENSVLHFWNECFRDYWTTLMLYYYYSKRWEHSECWPAHTCALFIHSTSTQHTHTFVYISAAKGKTLKISNWTTLCSSICLMYWLQWLDACTRKTVLSENWVLSICCAHRVYECIGESVRMKRRERNRVIKWAKLCWTAHMFVYLPLFCWCHLYDVSGLV